MADGGNFLTTAGFHIPDLLAGLAGGVLRAMLTKLAKPAEIMTATIGGALTANYATGTFLVMVEKATTWQLDRDLSAFVVGLTAMELCRLAIARVGSGAKSAMNSGEKDG